MIFQRPGSNALATAKAVQASNGRAVEADFPTGLSYAIIYNPTEFIASRSTR